MPVPLNIQLDEIIGNMLSHKIVDGPEFRSHSRELHIEALASAYTSCS
jgi:hypothetical protein